jgi:PAS domain S-box-containing protein
MEEYLNRIVLENQPIGFLLYEAVFDENNLVKDFILADCNEKVQLILGAKKSDLLGQNLSYILKKIHFDSVEDPFNILKEILKSGSFRELEKVSFDSVSWYRTYIYPLQNKYIAVYFLEVTDEVLYFSDVQNLLKEKTILLQHIQDSSPDIIFYKDTSGRYLDCNHEFSNLIGKKKSDIIGKTDSELFNWTIASGYVKSDREVLEKRVPLKVEEWVLYPDGKRVFLETLKSPLINESGVLTGLLGISRDLTSRKKMEEKLQLQEENFRIFFENLDDMIFIFDAQNKIIFTNTARQKKLTYTQRQLQKKSFYELFSKKIPDEVKKKDGTILSIQGKSWSGKWNGENCSFILARDLSSEVESTNKFNRIFERNPALMAIVSAKDHTFILVNKSFEEKTGYSQEDVFGKTALELNLFSSVCL